MSDTSFFKPPGARTWQVRDVRPVDGRRVCTGDVLLVKRAKGSPQVVRVTNIISQRNCDGLTITRFEFSNYDDDQFWNETLSGFTGPAEPLTKASEPDDPTSRRFRLLEID